jgi:hypothetical protein
MFQLEIFDGEQVYACNVCDQGFDTEGEIRDHILEDHKDIVIQISNDMENKEDMEVNQKSVAGNLEVIDNILAKP